MSVRNSLFQASTWVLIGVGSWFSPPGWRDLQAQTATPSSANSFVAATATSSTAGPAAAPLAAAAPATVASAATEAASAPATATAPPAAAATSAATADTPAATADTPAATAAADATSSSPPKTAGHSYHGEVFNQGPRQRAFLMQGTGNVHFPVDGYDQLVQQFVDQGVGQLHGFWFFEAERSFRQAAALDPDCAAAYWGMAMANLDNVDRAKKFIEQARTKKAWASVRVQRYVEALDKYLTGSEPEKDRKANYVRDLEAIVYDFPQDLEAKALLIWHLWKNGGNDLPLTSRAALDALIQQVLDQEPLHPVHHYRIHLWDHERPERALQAAASCGPAAPQIAHMWHMPGHIYSNLKRYRDAVWQQEASARVDHAQMIRDRILPDQIHNFAHNNEWLIRNLIFLGRLHDAQALALNMCELPRHPEWNHWGKRGSAYFGTERLLDVLLAAENWSELTRLAQAGYFPEIPDLDLEMKRLRGLGRAASRSGTSATAQEWVTQLEARIAQERQLRAAALAQADQPAPAAPAVPAAPANSPGAAPPSAAPSPAPVAPAPPPPAGPTGELSEAQKKAAAPFDDKIDRLEKVAGELRAYQSAERGEWEQALQQFRDSQARDRSYEAFLLRKCGKGAEALQLLRQQVTDNPQETIPLAQLIVELHAQQQTADLRPAFEQLRAISSEIDLQAPVFAQLAPVSRELGLPNDWRVAGTPATDLGDRPELDSLGPFRWHPPKAPDFQLQTASGETLSWEQYRDRPVVLIFYLGFGCLHCVEQLQAFAPQTAAFEQAGFKLLAISSDDAAGLQQSVKNFGKEFPFPLVSDAPLRVFKAYRAYDDFENQPLHGTFIIDAQRRVRWQDIGHQPFMDWKFVLQEGQRLLSIDPEDPH